MIDIGKLDRRLVLEAPVESGDGAGGVVRTFEYAATLWVSVTPKAGREAVRADALTVNITHRIVIRPRSDITTRHRLRDYAQIFRIVSIRDDASRRFLEIEAVEETQ